MLSLLQLFVSVFSFNDQSKSVLTFWPKKSWNFFSKSYFFVRKFDWKVISVFLWRVFPGFRRNECKPLLCAGRQIGLVRDNVEKELVDFPDVFKISNDHIEINPELNDYDSRSQVLQRSLTFLKRISRMGDESIHSELSLNDDNTCNTFGILDTLNKVMCHNVIFCFILWQFWQNQKTSFSGALLLSFYISFWN